MLILQKKEDNVSKIEQLFVKKVAKYKEKEDIFHKNKIEKCLFLKIALIHVQYQVCFLFFVHRNGKYV